MNVGLQARNRRDAAGCADSSTSYVLVKRTKVHASNRTLEPMANASLQLERRLHHRITLLARYDVPVSVLFAVGPGIVRTASEFQNLPTGQSRSAGTDHLKALKNGEAGHDRAFLQEERMAGP